MFCYLDSSVVLRKIFGQPRSLAEWPQIEFGFASRLLQLECLRTLDRMLQVGVLATRTFVEYRSRLLATLEHLNLVPLTDTVLDRAEQSFPTPIASLDSIHLATALLYREQNGSGFSFATHDAELALAAKAQGFQVRGI